MKAVKRVITVVMTAALSFSMWPVGAYAASDTGGHWAENVIDNWLTTGYISGYPDRTIRPDNPVTRAEFVTLANKAFGFEDTRKIQFTDVKWDYWAYDEIRKAYNAGYIVGYGDGRFIPENFITREEAAVMLTQIKNLTTSSSGTWGYTDSARISDWARKYVGAVLSAQIMVGFPDGSFRPQGKITRAESVVAINSAMSYSDERTTVDGDITLNSGVSSLKNQVIKGDLIIPKSNTASTIQLENITVEGEVTVEGGNTIKAENCHFKNLVLNHSGTTFEATNKSKITETELKRNGEITGSGYENVTISSSNADTVTVDAVVDYLLLDTDARLKLTDNADINTLEATKNADETTISLTSKANVDKMELKDKVKITGKGDIGTMTVYVSGVKSEIRPDTIKTKDGASKPSISSGGSSSGGSGGSSSSYDNLTLDDDGDYYNGHGKKLRNVYLEADDITLEDVVVTGNLTIAKEVGNGSVTLENVRVYGTTYVYGGGENSVKFKNCDLDGDIYSDPSNKSVSTATQKNKPVALKFDGDTTIGGTIKIAGNTKLEPYSTRDNVKISKVSVENSLQGELNVGVDVGTLVVRNKAKVAVQNVKIDTINIYSDGANSEVALDSKNARIGLVNVVGATISITGNGNVSKIVTDKEISIGNNVNCSDVVKPDANATVKLQQKTAEILTGGELQLTVDVTAGTNGNKNVTWSSGASDVASVNSSGLVKGLKAGTATITVNAAQGNSSDTCIIIVKDPIAVSKIEITPSAATLKPQETITLTAQVTPENAANKKITWTSDTEGVAQVDQDGKVTGVTIGKANVMAASSDGKVKAICEITVSQEAESIALPETLTLKTGETSQLTAAVLPEGATAPTILWESKNPDVASVSDMGIVTGNKAGTATITAKINNSDIMAECAVTITPFIQSISIETPPVLKVDESAALKVNILPELAPNQEISWSSSNEAVATVEPTTRKVQAKSEGVVTITAIAEDGNWKAECNIAIVSRDGDLQVTIKKNQSANLERLFFPSGLGEGQTVQWKSDNAAVQVKNGIVTGSAAGEATITAEVSSGGQNSTSVTAKCFVVEGSITGEQTVGMKKTIQLHQSITPPSILSKGVIWSSKNPGIASVDENGKVTGVSQGNTTITVTTKLGKISIDYPIQVTAE